MGEPSGALLDWQQARRGRGVPTVAALVGPAGLGVRAWRAWAGGRGLAVAQTSAGDFAGVAADWVAAALAATDPVAAAVGWLAGVAPSARVDPAKMTRFDLDQLWQHHVAGRGGTVAAAAHALLAGAIEGKPVSLVSVADPAAAFAGLGGLLPPSAWPALLLTPGPGGAAFAQAVRHLERVAVALPALPVGVCVAAEVYDAETRADSRPMAMAREGEVRVPGVSAAELRARLAAAGADPKPLEATVRRLAADGLAPEVAEAFVAAATAPPPPADADDTFRSEPERFLFDQLESMPQTAGLFRPNQRLEFLHGTRRAEADLVAPSLRIVVEVDGGYYHLRPEAYRSDRRKDYAYQRHGYLVLRFLAEDVVSEFEPMLTAILEAVSSRRPALPRPEVPPRA